MKKMVLYIVACTFVFVFAIYYFITVTNLAYVETELTSNFTNDKIESEMYDYISLFDKNILESLQVCDNDDYVLDKEQIIDITIKYIISHIDEFNDKLIYLDDEYSYECDGTMYYSVGYVDKSFFLEILSKLFATNDIAIEDSIYFDNDKKLVALLSIYGDVVPVFNKNMIRFEEIDYFNYSLTIQYFINDVDSFKIKYYIERNNFNEYGKYKLNGIGLN